MGGGATKFEDHYAKHSVYNTIEQAKESNDAEEVDAYLKANRADALLPAPAAPRWRVCVVEAAGAPRVDSVPIANGVIKAKCSCDILRYDPEGGGHDAFFARVRADFDACILRIAPKSLQPADQAKFDEAMVEAGKLVWSLPRVVRAMTESDALSKVAAFGACLADSFAYDTPEAFKRNFPETMAFKPRVLSWKRGAWLCQIADANRKGPMPSAAYPAAALGARALDGTVVLRLTEYADGHVEYHTVADVVAFCVGGDAKGTWAARSMGQYFKEGRILDRRHVAPDKVVRLYMAGDTCERIVDAAHPDEARLELSQPACAKLIASFAADMRDGALRAALGAQGEPLPLLWTCDCVPQNDLRRNSPKNNDDDDDTPEADHHHPGAQQPPPPDYAIISLSCSCVGVPKFQHATSLGDVSEADYYDASKLTDLMGIQAIKMLDDNDNAGRGK